MAKVTARYSAERIAAAVDRMAAAIAARRDAAATEALLMVALLKGAFVFAADLVRALDRHGVATEVDFLSLASYGAGTRSSGNVHVRGDLSIDVRGRDVLLVDDILDSGRSLELACRLLRERGAANVTTCVLLDKPSRRVVAIGADHVGFEVPDAFVVGYGIDWAERYRHLPWIGVVEADAMEDSDAADNAS